MVGPFVGKQPGEVENKNGVSCYAQTAVQLLGFIPGVAERAATLRSAALAAAASGGVDDVPRCKVTSAFCDLFQIMFRARAAPANPTRFLLACGVEMNKKKSTPLFTQIGRPRGAKQEDAAEFLRALLPILHAGGLPLYNIFNIVSTSMCCQCGAGEIMGLCSISPCCSCLCSITPFVFSMRELTIVHIPCISCLFTCVHVFLPCQLI
jgi:hypothetical protein